MKVNLLYLLYSTARRCCLLHLIKQNCLLRPKKITLVSGNAGEEKNLHPGSHKFIFFNRFSGDFLFSALVSFDFFGFLIYLFVCLMFFEIKNIYFDTL